MKRIWLSQHWMAGCGRLALEFAREAAAAGVAHVHGLRHTDITHLLRSGVPVHVVSARVGHAPSITLNIYAHMLPGQQEGATATVDTALNAALQE